MHSERSWFRWAGVLLLIVGGACSAGPDERRRNTGEGDERDWFEDCVGTFACTVYVDDENRLSMIGQLAPKGDDCLWLDEEGRPLFSLSSPEVSIYENYFTISGETEAGSVHVECLPFETTAKAGGCAGSAKSCSAVGFLDCNSQDGCHSQIGDAYTSSDDRCTGSADPCHSFDSKAACEHQQGCRWEG